MRNAVEQGAGAEIASYSKTKDFVLVKDEIMSRANGYISEYNIIKKSEKDGIWTVKISAKVKVGKMTSDWGEIALLIKQKGHPKVLVMIKDKIDGRVIDSEQANSIVVDYFLGKGMRLVDKDQVKEVDAKEIKAATIKNNLSKLVALAQRYKAQLVVTGTVTASYVKKENLYGQPFIFYSADATIKVYRTDDAQLLFQKAWTLNQMNLGQASSKDSAAKKAIKKITDQLAPEAMKGITKAWIKDLFTGNDITVVVSNCPYKVRRKIKKEIKKLKDVSDVAETSYAEKTLELTVTTTMSASTLLDKLVDNEIISEEDADNTNVTGNKIQIRRAAGG
jgi:hypothetical protein